MARRKTSMIRPWLAAGAAALLAGCAASAPNLGQTAITGALPPRPSQGEAATAQPVGKPVKVGLLLPLSGGGQTGLVADAMRKAAELSVIERNAPNLQLVVRDDKGTPDGAIAATRELQAAGVELVLGPLFARSVQAVAPLARQANLPVLAFSNDRQTAGGSVTLLSFLAEPEIERVVAYAAAKGKKRFIALLPDDAYGRLVGTALRSSLARHGGQLVASEVYPIEANRMLDAVKKLRDSVRGLEEHGDPIDALFLPSGEETLVTLMPQLRQVQFDLARIQIVGTGAMDYANAGRDTALHGAWFAAPDPKGWKDFSDRYAKVHGMAPPRIASLAYDAVGVAAALANGPDGACFIPSQLTRPSGFTGADGLFRLLPDGTTDRALAVMDVQAFGARLIEPAPATLGGPSDRVALSGLGVRPPATPSN